MASSERRRVVRSWLSTQASNCRTHSSGVNSSCNDRGSPAGVGASGGRDEASFFLRRQLECKGHDLQPYVFRSSQSLYIRGADASRKPAYYPVDSGPRGGHKVHRQKSPQFLNGLRDLAARFLVASCSPGIGEGRRLSARKNENCFVCPDRIRASIAAIHAQFRTILHNNP